jgi:CRISPR-associated protein Cmr4
MNTKILYIFTRTPLHVGAGSSVGAIDQPVQRERHTGYPIIPGSSIKGVLRDYFIGVDEKGASKEIHKSFGIAERNEIGEKEQAGMLSFTEASPLLFPVRSANGAFAFITCPYILNRYQRVANNLNIQISAIDSHQCLVSANNQNIIGNDIILEEYKFTKTGVIDNALTDHISSLFNDPVLQSVNDRLIVLNDSDFSYFIQNCCEVRQHVKINSETGIQENLFNEEVVPTETLFYATVNETRTIPRNEVFESLSKESIIQFGGNGSTGLGFCLSIVK